MDRLLRMFVEDYLAGVRELESLQGLVIDITWDAPSDVAAETLQFARELDLRIAEYTGGHISEDELKSLFREAAGLNSVVITTEAPIPAVKWRSASETQRLAFG